MRKRWEEMSVQDKIDDQIAFLANTERWAQIQAYYGKQDAERLRHFEQKELALLQEELSVEIRRQGITLVSRFAHSS